MEFARYFFLSLFITFFIFFFHIFISLNIYIQVEDTLKMLSNYFVKQRLEFGLYGLYPKYRLHTQPIATFLGLISHAYIISAFHTKYGTPQEESKSLKKILIMFIKIS